MMKWTATFATEKLRCNGRGHRFVKCNVEGRQSAQAEIVTPNNLRVGLKGKIFRATGQRFESELAFDARERGPETEVTGPTEREMPVLRAPKVQPIRIFEAFRIAVA